MFGFALDKGKNPEIISVIDNVKNLEGAYPIAYKKITLVNVNDISGLMSVIENSSKSYKNNGFLYMLDQQKTIITGTFISNIKIIKSKHNNNINLIGNVWQHPKGYQKAWNMKINNEINKKNIWKSFRKDELQGWLVYALHSSNFNTEKENIKILIDGNNFHNLDSFFCTLGEEINGPGGYFGRNLAAMDDCLYGNFGVQSISELIWTNHQKSKKLFKTKFTQILETFEKHKVKILLS
ncbi:barstar family protein [Chryseobacterium sp.]|uniref:barstar family protein n=1 Tax=Chryseobacterium sp. TaxID=1871047 RepID=UPI0033415828